MKNTLYISLHFWLAAKVQADVQTTANNSSKLPLFTGHSSSQTTLLSDETFNIQPTTYGLEREHAW